MKKGTKISTWIAVFSLMTGMMALSFVAISQDVSAAEAKSIKLRYGSYGPKSVIDDPVLWFIDEVSKRTGVEIELETYYAGTLAKPPDCLDAIGNGVYDFGWISPAFTPAKIPHAIIPNSVPLIISRMEVGLKAADELAQTYHPAVEEYKASNVKLLFHTGVWHYNLISKKPVKSLDDIKGLKVRTFGYLSKAWAELGGVPVSISVAEAYDSLQKGVIDGVLMTPFAIWKSLRLSEVAKNFTRVDLGCLPTPVLMNMNSWNNLPEKVRNEMNNLAIEMPYKAAQITREIEFNAIESMEKEHIKIFELGTEDKNKINKVKQSITNIVVEDLTAKGIKNAKEEMELFLELIQKHEN